MKMHFVKMKLQIVSYQKYKDFHYETFLNSLRHEFNIQGQFLNEKGLDTFSTICTETFANPKPFINNEISNAIMTRNKL